MEKLKISADDVCAMLGINPKLAKRSQEEVEAARRAYFLEKNALLADDCLQYVPIVIKENLFRITKVQPKPDQIDIYPKLVTIGTTKNFQPFQLWGKGSGTGKSHLACAVFDERCRLFGEKWRYLHVNDWIQMNWDRKPLPATGSFLIDDLGAEKHNESSKGAIRELIDNLQKNNKQYAVTSQLNLMDVVALYDDPGTDRTGSRLGYKRTFYKLEGADLRLV